MMQSESELRIAVLGGGAQPLCRMSAIVEHEHSDLPSTYYAMLWLDTYENGPTREPYTP